MSERVRQILEDIGRDNTKLGDLRKHAKEIKTDHALAIDLWAAGGFRPRMLAILTMDKKQLDENIVNGLMAAISAHTYSERIQLADWLMANQLMKSKHLVALIETWEDGSLPIKRRIFWYYQGRLRWTGQASPPDTERLLVKIESGIAGEDPEVQWAMNFTAGWIGVYTPAIRSRCVAIGETTGLFKDDMVSKGCTPNYLPQFIEIEAGKRNL